MRAEPRANGTLQDDPSRSLRVLQASLPVLLIATDRREFSCCRPNDSLAKIVEENRDKLFDFIPVVSSGEDIVGVLEIAPFMRGRVPAKIAGELMRPLGENHLIGADASILEFVSNADRSPFRFVVSGGNIRGLVTFSDLQQLPVRAALFSMVTHLESTMARVIRHHLATEWMRSLSKGRAAMVDQRTREGRDANTLVDPLHYTEFCDKVTIVAKAWPRLEGQLKSKAAFERDMKDAQHLRDKLAHANEYAGTRDAAMRVCECVRSMDEWIRFLTGHTRPPELTGSAGRG